jgi:alpha/beta superfamily hydrolase
MSGLPNLQFFFKKDSDTLIVVLHGIKEGMEDDFMQKVISKARESGHSVVAFNFTYLDRHDDHSSGPLLLEEIKALKNVLDFVQSTSYTHIHIIGKSFGAIVASYYLKTLGLEAQKQYEITVLGYVLGDIDLKGFSGKISIIQGEYDRYGGIEKVKENLKSARSQDISFIEIPGGDHSYRDPNSKEPVYVEQAIGKIVV